IGRPKRLFVLINPYGGKRRASKIYEAEIKPLLEAAGVEVTMQETRYRGHAREVASSLDLARYDGIVCVSGDGVLVELVNGILQRSDWEEAIKMPIGVVPAGTGNGMAKSLLHAASETCSVSDAVFAIIRGHKQALDVCTIAQGEKIVFSVLSTTWGLVADVDIESEKYRWMGSARFDFYALVRIMNLRRYRGSVHFVPAPGYEAYGDPVKQSETPIVEQNGESRVCSYQGPRAEFQGSDWRSIDGPFVGVCVYNVPWAAENAMAAPEAKFSDGYMDAVILKDCPKADLLALLLKMSDGSYVKSPHVTYLKFDFAGEILSVIAGAARGGSEKGRHRRRGRRGGCQRRRNVRHEPGSIFDGLWPFCSADRAPGLGHCISSQMRLFVSIALFLFIF
uniref:sphingosine kinase n=1 Tax=Aegilops tauschii subsp. strangulata TaxID=200361 RepID=A0A453FPD1_AEGTS